MSEQTYLQALLDEIEVARKKKAKGVFKINEQVSDIIVAEIKNYFKGDPEYSVEIKKCKRCKNVWDIFIFFMRY